MYANRDRNNRPTKHSTTYYATKRYASQTPPRFSLTLATLARYAVIALVVAFAIGHFANMEPTYSHVRVIAGEAYVLDHDLSADDCSRLAQSPSDDCVRE